MHPTFSCMDSEGVGGGGGGVGGGGRENDKFCRF